MKLYNQIPQLSLKGQSAVALGYFDGLHIGHRAVISAAVNYASANNLSSALFSFSLENRFGIKGRELLTVKEKQLRAEELGMQHYICPPFSTLHMLTCEQFVEELLVKALGASAVFCGADYTFGANKAGNTDVLKSLCRKRNIYLEILPMQTHGGESVSSTRIRNALENGNITEVNAMLQKPYAISLSVVHGQGLGHKLGVPTINQIYPDSMLMPKGGVYATRVAIDNKLYSGATGLGSRPTVNGEGISCETFINGYSGNLYGQEIRVEFLEYLQETEKFETLDNLRECIINAAQKSKEISEAYH